eukprot:3070462-Amphidinium_carterae.1
MPITQMRDSKQQSKVGTRIANHEEELSASLLRRGWCMKCKFALVQNEQVTKRTMHSREEHEAEQKAASNLAKRTTNVPAGVLLMQTVLQLVFFPVEFKIGLCYVRPGVDE